METVTFQAMKQHEITLENGKLFPTAANETIVILKSFKESKYLKMDAETKLLLNELLDKYGNYYFIIEDE
ncbi:MAG: hypothetical protein WC209_01775 [Ignavibacteriaceae bacterium]|jgi:hypothetical protein